MSAIVIASHGSERNDQARVPGAEHALRLMQTGRFSRVLSAYWKGEPHISTVMDGIPDTDITVVPFFMADGYYTRIVVPREMRLKGPVTHRGGKTIRYTMPVGSHPRIAEVIIQRAVEGGARPTDALVLLGHGTEKHRNSGDLTFRHAGAIRAKNVFSEVATVFIDQEPNMRRVFELVKTPDMIMVPVFAADGWHVSETVPEDMGIESGHLEKSGRRLRYTPAIGTHPAMADIMLALIDEATRL